MAVASDPAHEGSLDSRQAARSSLHVDDLDWSPIVQQQQLVLVLVLVRVLVLALVLVRVLVIVLAPVRVLGRRDRYVVE